MMLLVIDVGNTNTAIGIFRDGSLLTDWRLATDRYRTTDEWGQLLCNLLSLQQADIRGVSEVAISCVVPPLQSVLERMCERYFRVKPLFVDHEVASFLPIMYENPQEVGADRIVNAVAAVQRYGAPCIIIDFGTATTFDAVDAQSRYLGGVICPGVGISTNALFEKAAKLPRIDVVKPPRVIGTNTVASMQSGVYYGYLEQVKGIVGLMREEMGTDAKVISTGGFSRVFAEELGHEVVTDLTLTLDGLRIISERSRA